LGQALGADGPARIGRRERLRPLPQEEEAGEESLQRVQHGPPPPLADAYEGVPARWRARRLFLDATRQTATARASETTARVRCTALNAAPRVSSRSRLRTKTAQMNKVHRAVARRSRVSRRGM